MTTPYSAKKKKGKSAGIDNIPAELVQADGEDVITTICNKTWETAPWPQSLVNTLPKKGNLQQCQNNRTISIISHAEDHTEETEAAFGEDHCGSRKEHHRADLQPKNPL